MPKEFLCLRNFNIDEYYEFFQVASRPPIIITKKKAKTGRAWIVSIAP